MPERKTKFLIPAVGAAVVVVAGSVAAYMYLNGPSGEISGATKSAKLVPAQAIMATYISTDSKAWSKLQQFGTPEAQAILAKNLEDYTQQVIGDRNISYEKDLKPWVGGVMIAILPPESAQTTQNTQPVPLKLNILKIVGIKDKLSALNFANKLKGQKDVTVKETDYKGEKIIETTNNGKLTYSAVLNDQVVFATQQQTVEKVINTVKGEPSFASQEGANNFLSQGVNIENTVAQMYVPNYAVMVQQLIAATPQASQLPPQTLAQLKQVKSLEVGVGIDHAGLRMKAIANLDPQLVKYQYQNTPNQVVSQLPGDTIALVSGQGISRWWAALVEQSKDSRELSQALQQTRSSFGIANIDLDKDVFGWMDGEFGFAAIPSNQGVLASIGVGGAFIFHTSDRKTAEASFAKLDNLVKIQQVNIAQTNIGGKDVTEWQIPQQGALLSHGWLNQDTVFVALGGPIAEAIASPKNSMLDSSENFKAVTNSLPKPNGGYLYLDIDKAVPLLNRFATLQQQPMTPESMAILSSIRGLGVTATSPNNSTSQVEMLLALKPKTGN